MTLTVLSLSNTTPSPAPLRVALAGNPNCGKTSLFNALTGARQHVANDPGVTVERRTGSFDLGGESAELVDLPGTYSLSACSPEERAAEEEVAAGPDVVVVVADSMQLQRNLVLLVQVLLAGANPVLCLNMADEARAGAEALRRRARIEAKHSRPVSVFVAERTFGFVDGLLHEARTPPPRIDARALSDRLDDVVAHRWLGLPIFAAVLYGIFWLTFTVGKAPMGWIESGVHLLGGAVSGLWPAGSDSLLRTLLVDGVIAGVGGVLVFLPNILLLFLGLALLEDSGYMARAAFLTDRAMHRFGLHGKSFLPMMTGFGCTVPGILATRTLENERDRLTTMLVLPLMSCRARLPIWMLLVPAYFPPAWRAPALWLICATGIALALLLALLLRRTILPGDDAPFVMELPPYRVPTPKSVLLKMLDRGGIYLRKAGTVILGISILLWAATSFPKPSSSRVDARLAAGESIAPPDAAAARAAEELEASLAGRAGRFLEPAFAPLGFDAKLVTAMIGAFAAKEVFVAQMGIVYAIGDAGEGTEGLRARLSRDDPPLVGVSLVLFLLVATPCMATVAVTRRESGRWRWALLQLFGLTSIAWLLSFAVTQLGRLFA